MNNDEFSAGPAEAEIRAAEQDRIIGVLGRKRDRLRAMAAAHPDVEKTYLEQAYGVYMAMNLIRRK